jgi:hypothetical protein
MVNPAPHLPSPPPRQLPLPLASAPGPAPPWLPPELAALPTHRIWTTLAPADRAQVRATILHIIQEVLNDRYRP